MLDIEPKYVVGRGIFDIAKKLTNSTVAKKIMNSAATEILKRATDSALRQELKKVCYQESQKHQKNASEGAFEQLGLSHAKNRKK